MADVTSVMSESDPSEGTFTYTAEDSPGYSNDLLKKQAAQREKGDFCDVVLIPTDDNGKECGKEIPAHKCVLAVSCEYFSTMFLNGRFREARQKKVKIQMAHPILLAIVMYFYSGTLTLASDLVPDLIDAASYFELDSLKEEAGKFLVDSLTVLNCLELLSVSEKYSLDSLHTAACRFACRKFRCVANSPDFLLLSIDILLQLLADDRLNVGSEEVVYEAVLKWVREDASRQNDLHRLLSSVRLPQLRTSFLFDAVDSESDPATRKLFTQALRVKQGVAKGGNSCLPRDCYHSSHTLPWSVNAAWSSAPNMEHKRFHFNVGVIDERRIYAVGGRDENKMRMDSVEMLDVEGSQPGWSLVCPLPEARVSPGVCSVLQQLYVVGGKAAHTSHSVLIYDAARDRWRHGPNTIRSRSSSLVSIENVVYAAGCANQHSPTAESLDTRTGKWRVLPAMQIGRESPQLVVRDWYVYAFGDDAGETTIERLDVRAGQWTLLDAEMDSLSGYRVARCYDQLIVCGGVSSHTRDEYGKTKALFRNSWNDEVDIGARTNHALCAIGDTLFALGGLSEQSVTGAVDCLPLGFDDHDKSEDEEE